MVKSNLLTALLFTIATQFSFAQIKAVTENGDEVLLNSDGTWRYTSDVEAKSTTTIKENTLPFKKPVSSTFLLKSAKINVGFWLDPKVWSFKKADAGEASEYKLSCKTEDFYAMIITEKIEIPLEELREIAIENAREAAPDIKVVSEEYRNVNGLRVFCMQMEGSMKGIKFSYLGYYYTTSDATVQFVTYTSQALMKSKRTIAESLLNGIVKL